MDLPYTSDLFNPKVSKRFGYANGRMVIINREQIKPNHFNLKKRSWNIRKYFTNITTAFA